MSKPQIPPRRQTPQGALLALKNSDNLINAGRLLADSKAFGPATSLMVLAGEEIIKAWAWMMSGMGMPIPVKNQRELLQRHPVRHDVARAQFMMIYLLIEFLRRVINVQEKYPEGGEGFREARMEMFMDYATGFLAKLDSDPAFTTVMEWWEGANTRKNRGFYVDLTEGGWLSPEEVTHTDFQESLEIVTELREVKLSEKWYGTGHRWTKSNGGDSVANIVQSYERYSPGAKGNRDQVAYKRRCGHTALLLQSSV